MCQARDGWKAMCHNDLSNQNVDGTHLAHPYLRTASPGCLDVHTAGKAEMGTYRTERSSARVGLRANRDGFALVHYAVLSNHLHLFVTARDKRSLAKGMQGLAVRIARALNRHWRRKGTVFFDRYHSRVVKQTVHAIKKVLRYVLQNARKHGVSLPAGQADPYSSARWFNWFDERAMRRPLRSPPVARPLDITTDICLLQGLDLARPPGLSGA